MSKLVCLNPRVKRNSSYSWYGLYQCYCGNEFVSRNKDVKSGNTTSCGCYRLSRILKAVVTHNKSKSSEFQTWANMIQRCYNKKIPNYYNYGGRGITVCDRWLNSFENFYADVGAKPPNTSIDRINNDGNYEPTNCKWSTKKEQANNRRCHGRHKSNM